MQPTYGGELQGNSHAAWPRACCALYGMMSLFWPLIQAAAEGTHLAVEALLATSDR